jgi:hypothetical protein
MFEREDWKLFRNIETLCQKAGVSKHDIPNLVIKELVDNALDVSTECNIGKIQGKNGFYVQDYGDGISENILKDLFSINRPMITSKLLRLPTRGALGNGLRVVTGAVISTNGQLFISTNGYKYEIHPQEDGTTIIEKIDSYYGEGTKIEVIFGSLLPVTESDLVWGRNAILFAEGDICSCKTSAYWYTSEAFYELVNAYDGNVEDLLLFFNGINSNKSKEISSKIIKSKAKDLSFNDTEVILELLRYNTREISSKKLGYVGDCNGKFGEYTKKSSCFLVRSAKGKFDAEIPYIIETWVKYNETFSREILVNKTPITGSISSWYKNRAMTIYGCGLVLDVKSSRPAQLVINLTTPYMPITSDGKSPNFSPMNELIQKCLNASMNKTKKIDILLNNNNAKNEREIVFNNMYSAIRKASGDNQYRFSQRQLYYAIRPYVMTALDKQTDYNYFCRLLTEYENEYGDIEGLYRDPRGTLYHPHLEEEIPLGTIAVNNYKRPEWTFNKILYCEKEGFFPILRDAKFPERFDCALLSSKGYASRAVKDLFDLLGETNEEILFFCIHDADSAGTMIYETLQEATLSRATRKVKVINLGLDPWEAIKMDLEIETFESKSRRPVAQYVMEYDYHHYDEDSYEDWLQTNRVELNAMTTPQFLEWLEENISQYDNGKVIPDKKTMQEVLESEANNIIYTQIMNDILAENNFNERFKTKVQELRPLISKKAEFLQGDVKYALDLESEQHWTKPIKDIAKNLLTNIE